MVTGMLWQQVLKLKFSDYSYPDKIRNKNDLKSDFKFFVVSQEYSGVKPLDFIP